MNNKSVDLAKRHIINGDIEQQINDYILQFGLFKEEIEWWFSLQNQVLHPERIRKPICIELYEYTRYLQWLKNDIEKSVRIICMFYKNKGLKSPLKPVGLNINKDLESIRKKLEDPRNKFAAHRYTTKSKGFLTIKEIISLTKNISDNKLISIKEQLFKCHNEIMHWYNNNRNYLLLTKLKNI